MVLRITGDDSCIRMSTEDDSTLTIDKPFKVLFKVPRPMTLDAQEWHVLDGENEVIAVCTVEECAQMLVAALNAYDTTLKV